MNTDVSASDYTDAHPFKGRQVYVVDDDRNVRQSLHVLLQTFGVKAWPFACAEAFLDILPTLKPAPILLDIRMPRINGLQVLETMRENATVWPVIMISAHGDIATAVRAVKLGAMDFLEKPFAVEHLESALGSAFEAMDETELTTERRRAAAERLDRLSPRESEVISILVKGVSNKSAAHRLGLSTRTVEMHRKNALTKLGVRSIAEVIALALTAKRNIAS